LPILQPLHVVPSNCLVRLAAPRVPNPCRQPFSLRWSTAARHFAGTNSSDGIWQGVWADCCRAAQARRTRRITVVCPAKSLPGWRERIALLFGQGSVSTVSLTICHGGATHTSPAASRRSRPASVRQPLEETLLCFLCSSTKQFVQINRMVELLGAASWPGDRAGNPPSCPRGRNSRRSAKSAPLLPARLSRALRQPDRTNPGRERGLVQPSGTAPLSRAKERLRELPGVGEKVCGCVLLFGAAGWRLSRWRVESPKRWNRVTRWRDGLRSRSPILAGCISEPVPGLAQQYLFAWERAQGRS